MDPQVSSVTGISGLAKDRSAATVINVVVTGNAPYREHKYNTSRMIRDALPEHIKDPPGRKDIRIWRYHKDSLDTYDDILKMMEEIWDAKRDSFLPEFATSANTDVYTGDDAYEGSKEVVDIAFCVHLGMTTREPLLRFEKRAYRDGYIKPGEDGVRMDPEYFKTRGLPEILEPILNIESAAEQAQRMFPDVKMGTSSDSNSGFCEFRLYASLAEAQLNHGHKLGRAVFMHVPPDNSPEAIELAAKVAAAYITALANDAFFLNQS